MLRAALLWLSVSCESTLRDCSVSAASAMQVAHPTDESCAEASAVASDVAAHLCRLPEALAISSGKSGSDGQVAV